MKLKAGNEVLDAMALAYRANQPVLLEGPHGIGKSQLIEQAAAKLGIGFIVRDLSLMEPPDLIGLPTQQSGKTVYSPPNFLPAAGRGMLVFEELNRSERYMMSPCLQLLTARTLNDYALPEGWLPLAAINPAGEGYDTRELDPALLSRFMRVEVVADVPSWLKWAVGNGIHPTVQQYVGMVPNVFESTNPRSWAYASNILFAHEGAGGDDRRTLVAAFAGLVGEMHAKAFAKIYRGGSGGGVPTAENILRKYPSIRPTLAGWVKTKQTDLLSGVAHGVQVALQNADLCAEISKSKAMARNLGDFIKDLPADLGRKVRAAAKDGGAL